MAHRAFNALGDMCSRVLLRDSTPDSGLYQCNVCHQRRGKKTTIVNNHLQKPESGMCYQAYSMVKARLTSCFHSEETINAIVKECIELAQAQGVTQLQSGSGSVIIVAEGSISRSEKRQRQEDGSEDGLTHETEALDDLTKLVELLNHMQLCAITRRPCAHPHCRTGRAVLLGLVKDEPERTSSGPLSIASGSPRFQSYLQPARSTGALPAVRPVRMGWNGSLTAVDPVGLEQDKLPVNDDLLQMLQELGGVDF